MRNIFDTVALENMDKLCEFVKNCDDINMRKNNKILYLH